MVIYIVTVNGKVSSEAYATLRGAYDFIRSRTDGEALAVDKEMVTDGYMTGYANMTHNGYTYTVTDVTVKE